MTNKPEEKVEVNKTQEAIKVLQEEQKALIEKYQTKLQVLIDEMGKENVVLDVSVVVTTKGNFPQINVVMKV